MPQRVQRHCRDNIYIAEPVAKLSISPGEQKLTAEIAHKASGEAIVKPELQPCTLPTIIHAYCRISDNGSVVLHCIFNEEIEAISEFNPRQGKIYRELFTLKSWMLLLGMEGTVGA